MALCETAQRDERQQNSDPRGSAKSRVGRVQEKQTRRCAERHRFHEAADRLQAALAEQRDELVDRDDEANELDEREATLQEEARIPVGRELVVHPPSTGNPVSRVIAKTW